MHAESKAPRQSRALRRALASTGEAEMSTGQTRMTLSPQSTRYAQAIMPVDFSARGWQPLPLAETLALAVAASPLRLVHIDTSSPWNDALSSDLMLRARPFDQPVQVQVRPDLDAAHGIVGA